MRMPQASDTSATLWLESVNSMVKIIDPDVLASVEQARLNRRTQVTKIKRKTVSVTVSRTVQVVQYQPSTVTVTETADVGDQDPEEVKLALYESASKSMQKFMRAEIKKYKKDDDE